MVGFVQSLRKLRAAARNSRRLCTKRTIVCTKRTGIITNIYARQKYSIESTTPPGGWARIYGHRSGFQIYSGSIASRVVYISPNRWGCSKRLYLLRIVVGSVFFLHNIHVVASTTIPLVLTSSRTRFIWNPRFPLDLRAIPLQHHCDNKRQTIGHYR